MSRPWKSPADLADALLAKAYAGRQVQLSPETARLIAFLIRPAQPAVARPDAWRIDLHKDGSCVYRLDDQGDILQIDAWARSSAIGRLALAGLKEAYPQERFEQRRRSWVEGR